MIHNSKGEFLLEEYARTRKNVLDPKCSAIKIEAREFKPIPGGDYHLTMRFESVSSKEKIFGMGQYQQDSLDLKGHDLELAHRNSQASVPFALSSLGYGFLWNNPGIGRAVLGKNIMTFEAYSTGGATCLSGAPNEVWSYGEEVYEICKKYMLIREEMRDYTRSLMKEAHLKGSPVMRPLFHVFPEDKRCWEVEDQYMFGDKYLICPVLAPGIAKREVYLPAGAKWFSSDRVKVYEGGISTEADCPLDTMPFFVRA